MPNTNHNGYGSSWYTATRVSSPTRGPLVTPCDVDVCVIGGGLAGLTAAREVARRGWSVAVLEAQHVAWNASGRNTGFVVPGFAAGIDTLIARVGADHAKALWALSEAGVEYVRNAIRDTGEPGVDMTETGWLRVSKTGRPGAVEAECERLSETLGATVEAWPAEWVREVLRSPLYFGALHFPRAFSIHPLNYALGLAAAAEAFGARIYEETQAVEIDPVGVRKRVVTKQGLVRAAHVVLAGNVHLSQTMPQFAGSLLPVFTYVVATAPIGDRLREAIRYDGAVSDSEFADNHYRVVDGERLIWSGRSTVWRGHPQRYVDTLLRDIARAYPQLGPVTAEYAWTGTLGHTVHRMPQIGEISPGLWLLSGFGSHGLNTTAMGGDLIARAIVEGDTTWRLFTPFEMVWAGGAAGRIAQQFYYWTNRGREMAEGWLARRRDGRPDGASASPAPAAQSQHAAALAEVPSAPPPQAAGEPEAAEPRAGAQMSIVPDASPVADGEATPSSKRRRRKSRQRKAALAGGASPAGPDSDETAANAAPHGDGSSNAGQ